MLSNWCGPPCTYIFFLFIQLCATLHVRMVHALPTTLAVVQQDMRVLGVMKQVRIVAVHVTLYASVLLSKWNIYCDYSCSVWGVWGESLSEWRHMHNVCWWHHLPVSRRSKHCWLFLPDLHRSVSTYVCSTHNLIPMTPPNKTVKWKTGNGANWEFWFAWEFSVNVIIFCKFYKLKCIVSGCFDFNCRNYRLQLFKEHRVQYCRTVLCPWHVPRAP